MRDVLHQIVPVVVLQAGSLDVAVPAREVLRFVLVRDVEPVPLTPPALLGVTAVAGEAALVVDLPRLVDQPRRAAWPAALGVWAKVAGDSLVLVGASARWIGRLRRHEARAELAACQGIVEWKGAQVPLLSWPLVLDAAFGTTGPTRPSWPSPDVPELRWPPGEDLA